MSTWCLVELSDTGPYIWKIRRQRVKRKEKKGTFRWAASPVSHPDVSGSQLLRNRDLDIAGFAGTRFHIFATQLLSDKL